MIAIRNALLFFFIAPAAFADENEIDRLVELTWDNRGFDVHAAVLEARIGGEKFFERTGERCVQVGDVPWIMTDVLLHSLNPDPNRELQFGGTLAVSLHYADGGVTQIFEVDPQTDYGQSHAMSLTRGLVVPPQARVCFDGWDGSSGYANRTALRLGRVIGHLPED